MSNIAHEGDEPVAGETLLRTHAEELRTLASRFGVTELRVAGAGRLVGHIADDRDLFDVAQFETAAAELLGGEVELFSDGVLDKANVSPDLVTATPL